MEKGWKIRESSFGNGTGFQFRAELEPDHYDHLREISKEFSRTIIEKEEEIILTGLDTGALIKLRKMIDNELMYVRGIDIEP